MFEKQSLVDDPILNSENHGQIWQNMKIKVEEKSFNLSYKPFKINTCVQSYEHLKFANNNNNVQILDNKLR